MTARDEAKRMAWEMVDRLTLTSIAVLRADIADALTPILAENLRLRTTPEMVPASGDSQPDAIDTPEGGIGSVANVNADGTLTDYGLAIIRDHVAAAERHKDVPGIFDEVHGRCAARERAWLLAHIDTSLSPLRDAVVLAAVSYRAEEQNDTPRIWRGKLLQDLGEALDRAIDALQSAERDVGER